ncbi:MAG: hypothetical protein HUJ54_14965, partial [Erysipelotrichaceae bacterium]|nr:hypothetical protein [Erysipelotrichaceae bacterium]
DIEDGKSEFILTGYFMQDVSVSLDGTPCTSEIKSLGNDKYELTVKKPAGYQGGAPVITVSGSNGNMDRSIVEISAESGQETAVLYDHPNIPVPSELSTWANWDLTGYNGKIYVYPRSVIKSFTPDEQKTDHIYAYNPENGEWETVSIPLETLTVNNEPYLENIRDVTACVKDGKLILLLMGQQPSTEKLAMLLISLDADGKTEVLGYTSSFKAVPMLSNLTVCNHTLYVVGGMEDTSMSPWIRELVTEDDLSMTAQYRSTIPEGRPGCRVSCQNETFLISGGLAS